MKKLLLILLLASACGEVIEPQRLRAKVVDITIQDDGSCVYEIQPVIPYAAPTFTFLRDGCGVYEIGQVLFF